MKSLLCFFSVLLVLTACGGGAGSSGSNGSASISKPVASDPIVAQEAQTQDSQTQDSQAQALQSPTLNAAEDADDVSYDFLKGSVEPAQILSSAITGIDYPVQIYLPAGYADSEKDYPIVYALDGQWQFPGLPYLMEQANGEAILVAISQGPEDRRRTDYLLPGARDYFQFLTMELMPLIEPSYRVDTSNRTIVGTSFGGVFTTVAMLLDDVSAPHFTNYLAFDSSLYQHPELTAELLNDRYLASDELSVNYFTSSALPEGNDVYVTEFIEQLNNKHFSQLEIQHNQYQTTHGKVSEPSFTDAVRLFLTQK